MAGSGTVVTPPSSHLLSSNQFLIILLYIQSSFASLTGGGDGKDDDGGSGNESDSEDEFRMTEHEAAMQSFEDLKIDLKEMDEVFELLAQVRLSLDGLLSVSLYPNRCMKRLRWRHVASPTFSPARS